MYAIELFFSKEVENYVKRKWKELSQRNITSSMYAIEEIRPHVTLAVYNDIEDMDQFKRDFQGFFMDMQPPSKLQFAVVGTFPTTGTVFMKPVITRELLDLHSNCFSALANYSEHANQYYVPDMWNPHCTFGMSLSNEDINRTMSCILEDFQPISGNITEIGFVEVLHDGNRFISSKTLFSKKFDL